MSSWGILPTSGTIAAVASLVPLLLIAVVLALFLLTQRSRAKASTPADRQLTGAVFRDDNSIDYNSAVDSILAMDGKGYG